MKKALGNYDMLGVTILDVGNKSSMPDFAELALGFWHLHCLGIWINTVPILPTEGPMRKSSTKTK